MNKVQKLFTSTNPSVKPFRGILGRSPRLAIIDFVVRHYGWSTICIADLLIPYPVAKRTLHELAEDGLLLEEPRTDGDPVYHVNRGSLLLQSMYIFHCAIRDEETGSDTVDWVVDQRFHYFPTGELPPEPGAC